MKKDFLDKIIAKRRINSEKKKKELEEKVKEATKILINEFHPKRIFLFGSLLRGNLHSFSDIDLVAEGLGDNYLKAGGRLLDIFGECIDLKPWELLDESFKEKVLREGRLMYGDDL